MVGDSGEQEFKRNASTMVLPAIAAIAFGLAGLIGTQVLSKLSAVEQSVEALKIDVAVIKTDIQYMKLRQQAKLELETFQ